MISDSRSGSIDRPSRIPRGAAGPGRRQRIAPLPAGLTVVIVLAALALLIGQAPLHDAERERLSERSRLVERVAESASSVHDPELTRNVVADASFTPDRPDQNELLLRQFSMTVAGNPSVLVALVAPDGAPSVTIPAGAGVPVADLGPSWSAALSGRPAVSPVFSLDGRIVRATTVPVGAGRPWAVLVRIVDEAATQEINEKLVSLGRSAIALCDVDATGVAVVAWDPALRGRRILSANQLTGLAPRMVRIWTSGEGAEEVTHIAALQRSTGYTTVFQQPTTQLFADLRVQQHRRDVILLAVLTSCVGGLIGFGVFRERAARRSRSRLDAMLSGVRDIIVVVGEDRVVTFVSPAVRELLGYDASSWIGRRLTDFAHDDDVGRVLRQLAEPGGTLFDVRLTTASGGTRWFDLEASDLTEHPVLAGILITCHEAGERKSLQDELGYQASHDVLTDLANRPHFMAALQRAVETAAAGGASFAVLFIDLDHFKPVNDSLGHSAGDSVLRIVAERLTHTLREGDLAARLGGDEFGVLLVGADQASASEVADRIIASVRSPIAVETSVVHVDASIGVAVSTQLLASASASAQVPAGADTPAAREPQLEGQRAHDDRQMARPEAKVPGAPGGAAEHILHAADRAMYEAKQAGKGRFTVARASSPGPDDPDVPSEPPEPRCSGDPSVGGPEAQLLGSLRSGSAVPAPRRPAADPGDVWRRFPQAPVPSGRQGLRPRLGRWAPPLAAAGAMVAMAGASLWLQSQAGHAAERQRLADRVQLTTVVADFSARLADRQRLVGPVSAASWSLTDRVNDERIIGLFAALGAGGRNSVWALTSLDGEILAAQPPSVTTLPIHPSDAAWRTARGGRAGNSPVMNVDGVFRAYFTIPIMRDGAPVAILVVGESLRDTPGQANVEAGGSLGLRSGGFSAVDATGTVMISWDAELIGKELVSPADLANLPVGQARQVRASDSTDDVTIVSPLPTLANGGYVVFQQPKAVFYGDIRSGQRSRDASLLAVVAATIIGLTVVNGRRERTLRAQEAHLQSLLHKTHDVVIAARADGRITFISSAVETLLGIRAVCYLGGKLPDAAHPDDAAALTEFLRQVEETGSAVVRDIRLRTVDHSYRWFDMEAIDLPSCADVAGILLTCREIGERRILQDELRYRASHDPLTGLPNRTAFAHRLDALAEKGNASTFAVLYIDLDGFKPLNDTYGHDAGDEVLRIIGARLLGAGRGADTVCRLGGDEFAVVVEDVDGGEARAIAQRLLDAIRQPISIGGTPVRVDAAVGIAVAHPQDGPPEDVVRKADLAMYRAKEAGRGRFAVFAPTAGTGT